MAADIPVKRGDGEIRNGWVLVCGLALAALTYGVKELVEALLDDPSWLAGFALEPAIEVPILVIALKLWLRRRRLLLVDG